MPTVQKETPGMLETAVTRMKRKSKHTWIVSKDSHWFCKNSKSSSLSRTSPGEVILLKQGLLSLESPEE